MGWYIMPFTIMSALIGNILSRDSCIDNHSDWCGFEEGMISMSILYLVAFILPYFISTAIFLVKCKSKSIKEKIIVLLAMLLIYLLVFQILSLGSGILSPNT